MKTLIIFLLIVFLFLQYKLWIEHDSTKEMFQLKKEIAVQLSQNKKLLQRNNMLVAEVYDLKHGYQAIEEQVRSELGMVVSGEHFYQIIAAPIKHTVMPARVPELTALPSSSRKDKVKKTAIVAAKK